MATVPLPGYRDGDALPVSADAAAEALSSAIESCAEGRPFTLVGFSTGGLVAHSSARYLEARDIHPKAVVLIDSFPPSAMTDAALSDVMWQWSITKGMFWSENDGSLTAMAWHLDLFGLKWTPNILEAPLLLIQAADQLPSVPINKWAKEWPGLTECITTPGSHFGLLTEYVTQTAQTISKLLENVDATIRPLKKGALA